MVKEKQAGSSLNPESYSEGGGLLDNVNVVWKEVRFEMWDYNGMVPQAVPAMKIVMETEEAGEATQYFSAGSAKDWQPSQDGIRLVATGGATGINKTSNMAILISSLVEAGFPPEKIEDECTVFEGLECHMVRVPAPKRTGIVNTPRADGKVFEKTNLVVDTIVKLPWEKKGKTVTTKGKAVEEDNKIESLATQTVMEILEENPKGIDKKKLASSAFQILKANPDRNAVLQLIYRDSFLQSGLWDFNKTKGIVTPAE
jgi:hypothetical protein